MKGLGCALAWAALAVLVAVALYALAVAPDPIASMVRPLR